MQRAWDCGDISMKPLNGSLSNLSWRLSHKFPNFLWPINYLGVANGTSKNVGLGKFWQDLEISETFLISLEVSFFHGLFLLFLSLGLGFLTRISTSRRVSDFTIRHPFTWEPNTNLDWRDSLKWKIKDSEKKTALFTGQSQSFSFFARQSHCCEMQT